MELKRVVVTGMGALTPVGNTVEEYWNGLINGVSGAVPVTLFDAAKFKTRFACEVKDFDPTRYLDKKDSRKIDRFAQFALVVSDEAMADAGLNADNINPDRVGVVWGSGIGGLITFQNEVMEFAKGDGTPRFSPFFIPKMILDIAAGHISMRHNLRGPNFAVVSACASSTSEAPRAAARSMSICAVSPSSGAMASPKARRTPRAPACSVTRCSTGTSACTLRCIA